MKKRVAKYVFDRVYWHLLCLLPIIAYVISLLAFQLSEVQTLPTFMEFVDGQSIAIITDSFVYDTFMQLFGTNGILPLFDDYSPVLWYASYVVVITLVRMCVDFLIFLPDLVHKFKERLVRHE